MEDPLYLTLKFTADIKPKHCGAGKRINIRRGPRGRIQGINPSQKPVYTTDGVQQQGKSTDSIPILTENLFALDTC